MRLVIFIFLSVVFLSKSLCAQPVYWQTKVNELPKFIWYPPAIEELSNDLRAMAFVVENNSGEHIVKLFIQNSCGEIVNTYALGSPTFYPTYVTGIHQNTNQELFLWGHMDSTSHSALTPFQGNTFVIKLESDYTMAWAKVHETFNKFTGVDVKINEQNEIMLGFKNQISGAPSNFGLSKLNAEGQLIYSYEYFENNTDINPLLQPLSNGDLLVALNNEVVRFDNSGAMLWRSRISSGEEIRDILELPSGYLIYGGGGG